MLLPSRVEAKEFAERAIDGKGGNDGGGEVVFLREPGDIPVQLVRKTKRDVEAARTKEIGRHKRERCGLAIFGATAGRRP